MHILFFINRLHLTGVCKNSLNCILKNRREFLEINTYFITVLILPQLPSRYHNTYAIIYTIISKLTYKTEIWAFNRKYKQNSLSTCQNAMQPTNVSISVISPLCSLQAANMGWWPLTGNLQIIILKQTTYKILFCFKCTFTINAPKGVFIQRTDLTK